jgi:hypothetical protein
MSFQKTIDTTRLAKGLRPSKRMPRDSQFLTTCKGAVGRDGVLQTLDEITRLATATITDPFPYPNIFVMNRLIIVCGLTTIYEWVSGALVSKIVVTGGETWRAIDGFDFVWLTNGVVSVTRDPSSFVYALSTDLPVGKAIVNYNGQVIVGGLIE